MTNILLLVIVAAIALLLLILKTNALYVFFALCAGNVLVQFASKNMAYVNGHINTHLLPHGYTVSQPTIELAILLLPPVLVGALAKHNNGPSKWPINIFPAIATGVLGILFVMPLLSASTQASITQNKFWNLLEQYQVLIVGICVIVCLIMLVVKSYSHGPKKQHHKA